MKNKISNHTARLRSISREIMTNDLDQGCYQAALAKNLRGHEATMAEYIAIRMEQLGGSKKRTNVESPKPSECDTYQRVPQKAVRRSRTGSREARKKLHRSELWLSRIILLVASISSLTSLWGLAGNSLFSLPIVPLITASLVIQLFPIMMKLSHLCSQLTASSVLCILMACISCGSGVLLLKSNPDIQISKALADTEERHTILIQSTSTEALEPASILNSTAMLSGSE